MKDLHLRTTPFLANWNELREAIEQYSNNLQLSSRNRYTILLCCEEWFVNIVTHGYVSADHDMLKREEIEISLMLSEQSILSITFRDHGEAYNPLEHPPPSIEGDVEERQLGGLGIYFITTKMDQCHYEYVNRTNIFTMIKGISEKEDDTLCKL